MDIYEYKGPVFAILASIMGAGFLLMFLGGILQRKFQQPGEEKDVEKMGIKKEYYEQQKEYGAPKEVKGKDAFIYLWIVLAFIGATVILFILYNIQYSYIIDILQQGLYFYTISFGSVAVAILVAFIVGSMLGADFRYIGVLQRLHLAFFYAWVVVVAILGVVRRPTN